MKETSILPATSFRGAHDSAYIHMNEKRDGYMIFVRPPRPMKQLAVGAIHGHIFKDDCKG